MSVEVRTGGNVRGLRRADVIILGCKPPMCADIGRGGHVRGIGGYHKLLVSIISEVKIASLKEVVPGSTRVVMAMPNTAFKGCRC
ncbi:unnamed protein product [Tuber aestivum]|uniref:Pyrroline-5-carboxylate reductase catalytic N-terminal domain-containing protein n=1 Tax=Tuber aestivum TaxID=59557 RepID=A0A292PPJ1_9PEZI|nr:unnamed protein product [Tuber aestivum]